jgi:hypothetical protein
MSQLTLQEVIDRINQNDSSAKNRRGKDDYATAEKRRPEFYLPRITRRLARFIFST